MTDAGLHPWTWRSMAQAGAVILGVVLVFPHPGRAQESPQSPVFTRDIAPILQEKCQACHRPGYIAPMSLMTYEEVRPWARSIRSRRDDAADAAVAHRQDGLDSVVQERPVADGRAD